MCDNTSSFFFSDKSKMTSTASSDSKLSITSTAISFAESLDSKVFLFSSSTSFNTRAAISSCKFSNKNCDSKSDKFVIISAISA